MPSVPQKHCSENLGKLYGNYLRWQVITMFCFEELFLNFKKYIIQKTPQLFPLYLLYISIALKYV